MKPFSLMMLMVTLSSAWLKKRDYFGDCVIAELANKHFANLIRKLAEYPHNN